MRCEPAHPRRAFAYFPIPVFLHPKPYNNRGVPNETLSNLSWCRCLRPAVCLPALAQSQLITVVNFGGANGAAQKKAYFEPSKKATGKKS